MVDAGIVKATFIIDSRNMVKGLNDITKGLKGMDGTTKGLGSNFNKFGNNLSESEQLVKKLERSTAMSNLELQKMLRNTKLSNQQRNEFIETHRTLKKGLDAGNISIGQYNRSVNTLAKSYNLAYKNGVVFDETMKKQSKQAKESSKMMRELFLNTQLTTKNKVFGTNATDINNFNSAMKQANREVRAGTMSIGEYNKVRTTLAKLNNLQVKNNGLVYDSKTLSDINNKMRTFVELDKSKVQSMQRGIPITQYHNNLLEQSKKGIKDLETWKKAGLVTQSQYNDVTRRLSTTYENHAKTLGGLNRSYGTLANSTNMVTRSQRMQNYAMQVAAMRYNAVGVAIGSMAGLMVGLYMQQFTMARMQSIKLDQQMQQMFQTMKLGKGAFDNFNKALDDYVTKVPKVSKYTVGSTIAQVGKLNNLSLDQMKKMIPLTGDMVNMMQLNGRTAEDTMLAINDAFDGQFKRLQEIGVQGKEQLKQFGYDGSADSLINALDAISKQKGWGDLSKNVSTASDAFMILGNALDRIIVPAINLLTPAIVTISVAIADLLGWLNSMPTPIQGLATVLMIAGGAFAFMKIQMAWARMMGSEFMASITGLDQGMQRVTNTLFSAREVSAMLPGEFEANAINLAKLNHEAQTGTQTWGALSPKMQENLITTQRAKMQYDSLNRTQKAQINTLARMKMITKEEAMIELFGAETVNKNTLARTGNTASTNMGFMATIRATWAKHNETTAENMGVLAKLRGSLANIRSTVTTTASTIATNVKIHATNLATMATVGLTGATTALVSVYGILLIGIVAVVGAIYLLTETQRKGIDTMKSYNDFMENGEEKIESLKNASENYKNKAKELEDQRDRMAEKGMNTVNIEAEIAKAYQNSAIMAENAKNAEEALKLGREKGDEVKARNTVDQTTYLQNMNNVMYESGAITQEVKDKNNQYYATVIAGTDQMVTALERTNRIRNIGAMQNIKIAKGDHEYSKAFIENQKKGGHALEDRVKAYDELAEAKYKAETSDNWMDSASAWFEQGILRMKIGWIDTVMQWENFKITLGGIYNDLVGWWNGLTAYLTGAWNNTVKFFQNIWTAIVTPFQQAWSQISEFFQGIWTSIFGDGNGNGGIGKAISDFFGNIDWNVVWNTFIDRLITVIAHYNPITLISVALFGEDAGYEMQYKIEAFFYQMYDFFMLGLNNLVVWITEGWTGLTTFLDGIWTGIVTSAQNAWNTIVLATQTAWNWVFLYIWTPINNAYIWVVGKATAIWTSIVGVWNSIKNSTFNVWNAVKTTIFNTLNPIWTKVVSVVDSVRGKWNSLRDTLVGGAKTIYDKVWTGFLEPLKKRLEEFVHFITHPFGGGGSPGGGGTPGRAGTPGTAGGFTGNYAGTSFTARGNGTSNSRSNNIFSGLGNAIISSTKSMVDSTGVPLDPRFNYAGSPSLSAGKRLIEDPYECEEKHGKGNCYAGWESSWIDGIINKVKSWGMNIYGTTLSLMDVADGNGSLKLFEIIASKLISGTAYQFYYNGAKTNQQALKDKRFNCYDGAEILIDLARGLGLNASMGYGTWDNFGHVWAVVNGKNFDTTAFQRGYGWTSPSVRGYAGSPSSTVKTGSNLKVECDFTGATFIGMEDVENQMNIVAEKAFAKLVGKDFALGV